MFDRTIEGFGVNQYEYDKRIRSPPDFRIDECITLVVALNFIVINTVFGFFLRFLLFFLVRKDMSSYTKHD